jgi:hypothetical protein
MYGHLHKPPETQQGKNYFLCITKNLIHNQSSFVFIEHVFTYADVKRQCSITFQSSTLISS